MNVSPESNEPSLSSAVREAKETALEQVSAAWQMQVDRVRSQLEAGWREQLQQVLADRFADIETALAQAFEQAVEAKTREASERASVEGKASARGELTAQINHVARGLRQAENREVWIRTLLEATADFCGRAALFAITGKKTARFEGGLSIGDEGGSEFNLGDAPAFLNAVESKDTVVAMATRRELSAPLFQALGLPDGPPRKVYLLPLVLHGEAAGLLYVEAADDGTLDVPALELLATLAVHSMEIEVTPAPAWGKGLVGITGATPPKPAAPVPVLPKEQQEVHLRAQRFARTKVAELLLYKVSQVKRGRADRNLYGTLREEIDAARKIYQQDFFGGGGPMADYLHMELVGQLAGNDPAALGPGYPGPLG